MKRYKKVFKTFLPVSLLLTVALPFCTSCDDMLQMDSDLILYDEDSHLSTSADTLYSVIGILGKMQNIGYRTLLLGELRGDLVDVNEHTEVTLRDIAEFNTQLDNPYIDPTDYYAVINNCNYFLSRADTTLRDNYSQIYIKEFAAVKSFRAWTYLQLALIYGEVPFYTEPILTEKQANADYPLYSIQQVCDYFIEDLKPYVDTDYPGYGAIKGISSQLFFIPVRVLLGDLCLWSERYEEAAGYYLDYIVKNEVTTSTRCVKWQLSALTSKYATAKVTDSYTSIFLNQNIGGDLITLIPMDSLSISSNGHSLSSLYSSSQKNEGYYQLQPSMALQQLSKQQTYYSATNKQYAPTSNEDNDLLVGDLRLYGTWYTYSRGKTLANQNTGEWQQIFKFYQDHVYLYRVGTLYLRLAEALNRAGYPQAAFLILKQGFSIKKISDYLPQREILRMIGTGTLLHFEHNVIENDGSTTYSFTQSEQVDLNSVGIHSRGCGDCTFDTLYVLPQPTTALATYDDTISYQIPLVEEVILNELALETCFEGNRYYDLMRMALHRDDTDFLAKRVALRKGTENTALRTYLQDRQHWYMPFQ